MMLVSRREITISPAFCYSMDIATVLEQNEDDHDLDDDLDDSPPPPVSLFLALSSCMIRKWWRTNAHTKLATRCSWLDERSVGGSNRKVVLKKLERRLSPA
jgi:hypothetical protein